MIAEPPIPELGSVTASALAEVLATQFKLSVIASGPDEETNSKRNGTVPRRVSETDRRTIFRRCAAPVA